MVYLCFLGIIDYEIYLYLIKFAVKSEVKVMNKRSQVKVTACPCYILGYMLYMLLGKQFRPIPVLILLNGCLPM